MWENGGGQREPHEQPGGSSTPPWWWRGGTRASREGVFTREWATLYSTLHVRPWLPAGSHPKRARDDPLDKPSPNLFKAPIVGNHSSNGKCCVSD
jgi:hypothetical protein